MIEFYFETEVKISNTEKYRSWVSKIVTTEGYTIGELNYIFCDDSYLLEINQKYLRHDTLTDIITFDYTTGKTMSADIYISTERVRENAVSYQATFENELLRVMSHGILHLAGYKDKEEEHKKEMRIKEDEKIKMFHVEQ
ncbi:MULTISPECIES: rRNA maturation RNase YbeY [Maribacter]|uniref:Endoribonuclease YbeY n=1 Tax=Maribacter flavus TaxID=1658664 RepID=A0A5B2TYA6_9FLAO|nr:MULTISPECIES: rRNA maturation RNase YbeY [Maribacter]KAA2219279.1 rRNA maturation RNase YbeY [Maribacter flavus]MDC6404217.1 rRNA maturation RNase YbeY [Maribacter sp. PR66]MEE1971360.1 rRNA maturation RNase YbeY [Maribacter flavus]